jgi:transposase
LPRRGAARAPEDHDPRRRLAPRRPDRAHVPDGATNGDAFAAHVGPLPAPARRPGGIAVIDNLPAHKAAGARAAIGRAGAAPMFLPPNSPDFGPIDLRPESNPPERFPILRTIAEIEARLRKAAPRSIAALHAAIAAAPDAFTPRECANEPTNSGCERD